MNEEMNGSFSEIVSQETSRIILAGIEDCCKTEASQEYVPIIRNTNSAYRGELTLNVRENRLSSKKSLDTHKIWDKNGIKTLFLTKDKMVTVDVKFNRLITGQLWVRIYPLATCNKFETVVITSCKEHRKQLLKKVTNNDKEAIADTLFELNDPNTVYENIPISKDDHQVTARVRYTNPETSIHLAFKCYNTCVDALKGLLPKLMFTVESYNDIKNEFTVLGESFIYFKVCASPSRDYNYAAQVQPRKKLCLKNVEAHCNQDLPQSLSKTYYVGKNKYYLKMLHEKEIKLFEAMRELEKDNADIMKEAEYLEDKIFNNFQLTMPESAHDSLGTKLAANDTLYPRPDHGRNLTSSSDQNGLVHPKTEALLDYET